MKRKPLSMTKLYQYMGDFLIDKYKETSRYYGISQPEIEKMIEDSEIKDFIDYIWKNPK